MIYLTGAEALERARPGATVPEPPARAPENLTAYVDSWLREPCDWASPANRAAALMAVAMRAQGIPDADIYGAIYRFQLLTDYEV